MSKLLHGTTNKPSDKLDNRFVIILPTYNRSSLLVRAVNSIKAQKHNNWQCVIVNDGSSDNTSEVAENLAKTDSRIHILSKPNGGVNAARNTGIEYALSHFEEFYFLFIDDDDYLHTDCFEHASRSIYNHCDYKWHGFNSLKISNGRKVSRVKNYGANNYINDLMFGKNWRGDITSFIHCSLIENVRYCKEIKNGEEWIFWSQLAKKNDVFINNIPGSYKDYLPAGLTRSGFNRDKAIHVMKLKIKMLTPIVGEKKLIHQHVSLAKNLYQSGDKDGAKKILTKVFKLNPYYLRQYPHWVRQLFY